MYIISTYTRQMTLAVLLWAAMYIEACWTVKVMLSLGVIFYILVDIRLLNWFNASS